MNANIKSMGVETMQKIVSKGKVPRKHISEAIMSYLIGQGLVADQKTNAKLTAYGKEFCKTIGLIDEPLDTSKGYVNKKPVLSDYDIILLNTSGGKDSQVMIDRMVERAKKEGCFDRLIAVHADLGRVEWQRTKELVMIQCAFYDIPVLFTKRVQNDLLDHIESRGMFPDNKNRYCTSDHKRGPIQKVMTQLVKDWQGKHESKRKVKILNCMGMRKQESPARAMKASYAFSKSASNKTKRHVDDYLPIHSMLVEEVWEVIHQSGCPYHRAYDLGMPRLSCCFCIFAPKDALMLAGEHNLDLLEEYVRVENKIGHTFRDKLSLASILEELKAGHRANTVNDWNM